MPVLKPSQIGAAYGFTYDGSMLTVGVKGIPVNKAVLEMSYSVGLDGVTDIIPLGSTKATAMTPGVQKVGEITWTVLLEKELELSALIAAPGVSILGQVFPCMVQYRQKPTQVANSIQAGYMPLPPITDVFIGMRVVDFGKSPKPGGEAIVAQWKLRALDLIANGRSVQDE